MEAETYMRCHCDDYLFQEIEMFLRSGLVCINMDSFKLCWL